MNETPQTRYSLILRLRDHSDEEAWREFADAYEPLIYQMMIRCRLQPADALEQTQEVMTAVAKSIGNWEPDEERGKFRTWLFRIAKNILADYWTRLNRSPRLDRSSEDIAEYAESSPDELRNSDSLDVQFDREFQSRVFALAAEKVESRVKRKTWKAFWLSAVEQMPVDQISQELGLPVGSIYVAKSRVMKQMQDAVQIYLKTDEK